MSKSTLRRASSLAAMLGIIGHLGATLVGEGRDIFLPGRTTSGHHQIEVDCDACHTPLAGVADRACLSCHNAELEASRDAHAAGKFTDPRALPMLQAIDARHCTSCHVEHQPDGTAVMGVTVPGDFCVHCHADIEQERPSHRGMAFASCSSSGCHNYHDNTALYETFLAQHLDAPHTYDTPVVPRRTGTAVPSGEIRVPIAAGDHDGPRNAEPDTVAAWAASAHAAANVNCSSCHGRATTNDGGSWTDHPSWTACERCHASEVKGFLGGRHGMRLARGLPPMRPAQARVPMSPDAAHRELTCVTCHGPHVFDTRRAAVDACLGCHADEHSLAYTSSVHYTLWRAELAGDLPAGSGVSCATCHLPRLEKRDGERRVVVVEHNQNANLRPSSKMIRTVCGNCHGLGLILDALADPVLVMANFNGAPAVHVETLDMVARRVLSAPPAGGDSEELTAER